MSDDRVTPAIQNLEVSALRRELFLNIRRYEHGSKNNNRQATVEYPIASVTVSETYCDLFGLPNPDLVVQAEQRYRDDPDDGGVINVSSDGILLAGEKNLDGGRRAENEGCPSPATMTPLAIRELKRRA